MENLSEKFSVIIEKFLIWSKENDYNLFSKDLNLKVEWDTGLLCDFKEPGRNKLETFVKKLSKEYLLTKDNEKILDIKLMVNNFKDNKTKFKVKNEKSKIKGKKEKIYIDFDLDTSNTYNIDTLEYFTDDLVKVFGKPKKIKDEDSKYEWKVNINGDIYSIYDWIENNEKFNDITWYLAGLNEDKNNINDLYNYIDKKIKTNECETTEEKRQEMTEEMTEETTQLNELCENESMDIEEKIKTNAEEIRELFGESDNDDNEETEVNLDTISETLELDIDNLEF